MKSVPFIQIGSRLIGPDHPCFIVAELSGNHHQKFDEAVALIKAAAEAGADAVKLQTYTPNTITLNSRKRWFIVKGRDQPEAWKVKSLYELYEKAHTPWEWQPKLKKIAEDLGLILFSTPFDESAVDFLKEMNVPCYKVASYEAVHIPLLKKVAQTGKPVILSIGFASQEETSLAIDTLRSNKTKDIAVLHCVTAYSDKPRWDYTNLTTVADIKERFGVVSGFSDNNSGIEIPIIAATVGRASIIEKHFILDRSQGGPDAKFSIEPDEFKRMVTLIRRAESERAETIVGELASTEDLQKIMGKVHYGPASEEEKENIVFRPSIWVKKAIKKGERLNRENIRVARPSGGLAPKFFDEVLGKLTSQDIKAITPLSWSFVV